MSQRNLLGGDYQRLSSGRNAHENPNAPDNQQQKLYSPKYQALIDDVEAQIAFNNRKIEHLNYLIKKDNENTGFAVVFDFAEDTENHKRKAALIAEINLLNERIEQYKKEHDSNWEWFKNRFTWANFMSFLGLSITGGDLTGTSGFTTKVAMESTGHESLVGTNKFFVVLAAPFALLAIGVGTLIDTINTLVNYKSTDNLKTRLGANGLTLGIVGVALAAVLGAPALAAAVAVPFFVPALFMGILIAGYLKDRQIHNHTKQELEKAERELDEKEAALFRHLNALNAEQRDNIKSKMQELENKKAELNKAKEERIKALTTYSNSNSEAEKTKARIDEQQQTNIIKQLTTQIEQAQNEFNEIGGSIAIQESLFALQMQQRKVNILQLTVNHQRENRNVHRAFIAAVGMFLLGIAFTMFPFTAPIGIPLLLLAGAALYTGLNYNESNNTDKAKQSPLLKNSAASVETPTDGKSAVRKNIGYHIAAIAVAVAVTVSLTILTGGIALIVAAMASILACAVISAYKKYKQSSEREALLATNMRKTDRAIDKKMIDNALGDKRYKPKQEPRHAIQLPVADPVATMTSTELDGKADKEASRHSNPSAATSPMTLFHHTHSAGVGSAAIAQTPTHTPK